MTRAQGIDVSAYQDPPIDRDLPGLAFAFARASYGGPNAAGKGIVKGRDVAYRAHADSIAAAGLVLGAYHFLTASDPDGQAAVFLASIADHPPALVALDFELEPGHPPITHAGGARFLYDLKLAGWHPGLYASESGYPELGQAWRWVAHWSREPAIPWDFWQQGGGGVYDADLFNGSPDELRAFVLRTGVVLPRPPDPPIPPVAAMGDAPSYNLFPITTRRQLAIPARTVLYRPNGQPYTRLPADTVLGLILAIGTYYLVADGDQAAFVLRSQAHEITAGDRPVGI